MDGKIIKLIDPVKVYEREFREITLREPNAKLFMRLGAPRIPVMSSVSGSGYLIDRDDAIREYLKAIVDIKPDGSELMYEEAIFDRLSLADTLQVREALFDFFVEAAQKIAARRLDSSPLA
jgi:hypothetical protein